MIRKWLDRNLSGSNPWPCLPRDDRSLGSNPPDFTSRKLEKNKVLFQVTLASIDINYNKDNITVKIKSVRTLLAYQSLLYMEKREKLLDTPWVCGERLSSYGWFIIKWSLMGFKLVMRCCNGIRRNKFLAKQGCSKIILYSFFTKG